MCCAAGKGDFGGVTVLNTASVTANIRLQREIELKSKVPFLRDAVRTGEGQCRNTVANSHCLHAISEILS